MKIPYLRLILPLLAVLLAIHGTDFIWPQSIPAAGGTDGIKNLYTFAWYVDHNESITNFEGMAAPYGEHIYYTDGHPFLSLIWRPVSRFLGLEGSSAPLLSLLIHLSWLLTPIPLFLLFRHFGIRRNLAIAGAVGFTLLAPQILRYGGHYALAYTLALPLSWWLSVRAIRDHLPPKQLLLLAGNNLWWLGTHAYLGVMCVALTGLIIGFHWLRKPRNTRPLLLAIASGALPLLVFLGSLKLSDQHGCRLPTPYGYFEFLSSPRSIFFPQNGPLCQYTVELGLHTAWEGWAYIGVSAGMMLFSFLFWGYGAIKRGAHDSLVALVPSVLAAGLLFLIACGQPFLWIGRSSINYFPLLEQFRAIGRFAWPFYFVLTTVALVLLERIVKERPKAIGISISVLFFLVLAIEGIYHQQALANTQGDGEHPFSSTAPSYAVDALDALKASNSRLLLPMPYYHKGSEMYGRSDEGEIEQHTLVLSYHSNTPSIAAHLTRAPLNETRELLNLLSPFGRKEALASMFSDTLTVCMLNDGTSMDADEAFWWNKGGRIFRDSTLELRTISMSKLLQTYPEHEYFADSAFGFELNAIDFINGVYSSETNCREYPCEGATIIHTVVPDSAWIGKHMEASLLMQGPRDGCLEGIYKLNAQFVVQFVYGDDLEIDLNTPKQSSLQLENGQWAKTTLEFRVDELPDRIEFFVKGEWRCAGPICAKELQLMELKMAMDSTRQSP